MLQFPIFAGQLKIEAMNQACDYQSLLQVCDVAPNATSTTPTEGYEVWLQVLGIRRQPAFRFRGFWVWEHLVISVHRVWWALDDSMARHPVAHDLHAFWRSESGDTHGTRRCEPHAFVKARTQPG